VYCKKNKLGMELKAATTQRLSINPNGGGGGGITSRFYEEKTNAGHRLFCHFQAIMFFGQVVASYFLSFIVSLAFEAPVVSMLKIVAPQKQKKSH
jgi:hypothetical protein